MPSLPTSWSSANNVRIGNAYSHNPPPPTLATYLNKLTKSPPYDLFIFILICIDTTKTCYETDAIALATATASATSFASPTLQHLSTLTIILLAFYIVDLIARIYSESTRFFYNMYHCLDVAVVGVYIVYWVVLVVWPGLVGTTPLRVLRAARIIRIFRIIPSIRSLQVVVDALIGTLRTSVVDLLILLALVILVFGTIGHFLFGTRTTGYSVKDWQTLPSAFMTLWVLVCADGWTVYQHHLTDDGVVGSELFSVFFIFIGNFIIANLFIAVICQNIDEASRAERHRQAQRRREAKLAKRELFLRKQRRDMTQLVAQKSKRDTDFQAIVKDLVGALRHDEIVPGRQLSLNLIWLETFVVTLHYHENTMFRCQQSHFAMSHALAEYVDRRLPSKQEL